MACLQHRAVGLDMNAFLRSVNTLIVMLWFVSKRRITAYVLEMWLMFPGRWHPPLEKLADMNQLALAQGWGLVAFMNLSYKELGHMYTDCASST